VSFGSPTLLLALIAVPVLVAGYILLDRRRGGHAAAWATPALIPNLVPVRPGRRRHIPTILFLVGLTLLLVGFARPQAMLSVEREGATVVLAIDVSRSMEAADVKPSRLVAARAAELRFLDQLPKKYRVAVVTFADHVTVAVPPTNDRERVRHVLSFAPNGEGTALSEAAVRSADVAARAVRTGKKGGERPPAAVLMISDGAQTQGRTTPQQAAQHAHRLRIPIYTVSIGTARGVVERKLPGGFTERTQVPPDPRTLQLIARGSGGTFYSAVSAARLKDVYDDLGSRLAHQREKREITAGAAGAGLAFLVVGAFLSGTWFRRIV
jgi:Ca-activated chloride channel family protein